jgi:hypothetical protein
VARLAALLVEQDFGVGGTVTEVKGDAVKIAIQGGELVKSLDEWLPSKSVLAVCRIVKAVGKERAELLERTILQVQSSAG